MDVKLLGNNLSTISKMTDAELLNYYDTESRNMVVFNNKQMAQKILLNSYFGSYGNANFRYYSLDHAKSITLSGQAGVQYVSKKINEWLTDVIGEKTNYIVYGDTDSIYVTLEPLFRKYNINPLNDYDKALELLMKFVDGPMAKYISKVCEDYAKQRNANTNYLDMEREAIAVRGGIFVAKKKYALQVDNLEGVAYSKDKPYMKIMGLEIAKAGKYSEQIRSWLNELLDIILNENEQTAQAKIAQWHNIFNNMPLEEIGILIGVNEVDKWLEPNGTFRSGAPIGPKALVSHNRFLDKKKDYSVNRLNAGDKIFYVPLRKGNPAGVDAIGFVNWDGALRELDQWVDKPTLWEKNFISPAKVMLNAVKWQPVKKNKLF